MIDIVTILRDGDKLIVVVVVVVVVPGGGCLNLFQLDKVDLYTAFLILHFSLHFDGTSAFSEIKINLKFLEINDQILRQVVAQIEP